MTTADRPEGETRILHTASSLALLGTFNPFQIVGNIFPASRTIDVMNLNAGAALVHRLTVAWTDELGMPLLINLDVFLPFGIGQVATVLDRAMIDRLSARGEAVHPKQRGLGRASFLAVTAHIDTVTPHGHHRHSLALRLHWVTNDDLVFLDDPELPAPSTVLLDR